MSVKPQRCKDAKQVTYSSNHWRMLLAYRQKAQQVMNALETFHLQSIVHGSIARGDIKKTSDIDIFLPQAQNSFTVETAIEKANLPINQRCVVQATPSYAMKAHIQIDEITSVSFPLMQLRKVEREFYLFGGQINLKQLQEDIRVIGVDKRLMLIEPTSLGHVESSIIGRENYASKILGVSTQTILDRVHALIKRDKIGRTGVFIKKELAVDETFEYALKKLADLNPAVRRRLRHI
jgi:uncharacterized protein